MITYYIRPDFNVCFCCILATIFPYCGSFLFFFRPELLKAWLCGELQMIVGPPMGPKLDRK